MYIVLCKVVYSNQVVHINVSFIIIISFYLTIVTIVQTLGLCFKVQSNIKPGVFNYFLIVNRQFINDSITKNGVQKYTFNAVFIKQSSESHSLTRMTISEYVQNPNWTVSITQIRPGRHLSYHSKPNLILIRACNGEIRAVFDDTQRFGHWPPPGRALNSRHSRLSHHMPIISIVRVLAYVKAVVLP